MLGVPPLPRGFLKSDEIRNIMARMGFNANNCRALLRLAANRVEATATDSQKRRAVLEKLMVRAATLFLVEVEVSTRSPSLQVPMLKTNKWNRRSKMELKFVWLVVCELFPEYMSPTPSRETRRPEGRGTVQSLVGLRVTEVVSLRT